MFRHYFVHTTQQMILPQGISPQGISAQYFIWWNTHLFLFYHPIIYICTKLALPVKNYDKVQPSVHCTKQWIYVVFILSWNCHMSDVNILAARSFLLNSIVMPNQKQFKLFSKSAIGYILNSWAVVWTLQIIINTQHQPILPT